MALIEKVRREYFDDKNTVVLRTELFIFGKAVWENVCYTESKAAIDQFINTEDVQSSSDIYKKTDIGFVK